MKSEGNSKLNLKRQDYGCPKPRSIHFALQLIFKEEPRMFLVSVHLLYFRSSCAVARVECNEPVSKK